MVQHGVCGSCRHHGPRMGAQGEPDACNNPQSVYYQERMGDDDRCRGGYCGDSASGYGVPMEHNPSEEIHFKQRDREKAFEYRKREQRKPWEI